MKKLPKTTKSFFIVILIIFMIFSIKYNVNASGDVYSTTNTTKSGDVVYFEKPDSWGDVTPYLYAWDNSTQQGENANWPGIAMTQVKENLYQYKFSSNIPYTHIIFNNNNGTKTSDLNFICNEFVYNSETIQKLENFPFSLKTVTLGDTIYFEKPNTWSETVYIYMWNSVTNTSNADWNSKPSMAQVSDSLYSYTLSDTDNNASDGFDMVIFAGSEDGNKKQTKDLSFVNGSSTFIANNYEDNGKYDGHWIYEDKSTLSTLVQNTTLPTGDELYYTEDSYKNYKEQFNLAKTVINSKYVPITFTDFISQYDISLMALQFAYDNLKINTQILSDKINEMENVDTSRYEQSLVDAFDTSIQDAKNLLANPDSITVSNMKDAIANMETAYNNLVVDKTELETVINNAKEIDTTLYTDESAKNLLDALTKATEIYEDENASYADVQDQITKLNDAISKLVLKENEKDKNSTDNQNTSVAEESNTSSNPYTGDMILTLVVILSMAVIVCTCTTIYLKKHKVNSKH
ncbi:MAG: starch-binding protein [Clostridia bacterium]